MGIDTGLLPKNCWPLSGSPYNKSPTILGSIISGRCFLKSPHGASSLNTEADAIPC